VPLEAVQQIELDVVDERRVDLVALASRIDAVSPDAGTAARANLCQRL
jgi:hypothetical protein